MRRSTAARSSLSEPVPIEPDDSEETLLERVHAVEHQLLPHVVALALAGAVA